MKIEPRGKYPGIKVHLDEKEAETFLTLFDTVGIIDDSYLSLFMFPATHEQVLKLTSKIGQAIRKLLTESPDVLKDTRTPEEIRAALEHERDSAIEKLHKMLQGEKWNG